MAPASMTAHPLKLSMICFRGSNMICVRCYIKLVSSCVRASVYNYHMLGACQISQHASHSYNMCGSWVCHEPCTLIDSKCAVAARKDCQEHIRALGLLIFMYDVWFANIQWQAVGRLLILFRVARRVHCICIRHLKLRHHIIAILFLCQSHSILLQFLLYSASQEPCELATGPDLEFGA